MSAEAIGVSDGVVRVERIGHVMVITLNRPDARNAVNAELASALGDAVELLSGDDDYRVAVLTGEGKAFCAGMDLKALAAGEPVIPTDRPERGFAGFVQNFSSKPIIAAINGYALGGGLEIALACDIIVMSESATLGLPEVVRGLFAAAGGVPRIAQQIPVKIAQRMVLTGELMNAAEAARWGIANEVVAPDEVLRTALDIAHKIAANAPLGVQASKRLIARGQTESTWDPAIWKAIGADLDAVFSSEDAREGSTAFIEKRAPAWRGR
jgi:crotonobetainyl-CoA hydratase